MWEISPKEAIEQQKSLRSQICLKPLHETLGNRDLKTIAGADISLNLFSPILYAGIVVFTYPELKIIESQTAIIETNFPYIPGLLSFREIPGLLQVWEKLQTKPDLLMLDGQGIAHPRRMGIATHFGLVTKAPTIGCAKRVLTGVFEMPSPQAGSESPLYDKISQEVIGTVLRSKKNSNPLIISPGHLVTLSESVEIVKQCLRGYRLPEPTRQAHLLVNQFRKSQLHSLAH